MTEISFDDFVAVVTGGGRGLGRAYCLDLGRRGAAVVVNDLPDGDDGRSSHADAVVAEIVRAGGRAVACAADVAAANGAAAIVASAIDSFGAIDAVVANAGIMRNGFVEDLTDKQFDDVINVSLRGTFLLAREAWPHLRASRGSLVIVSSGGGMFGLHACSNYASAKGGTYGLSRALAIEGAPHGIRVNALLPVVGGMKSKDAPIPDWDENVAPREALDVLLPRLTNAAIAPLLLYLCSRECTVTGEAFSAISGRYSRVVVGVTPGWVADAASQTVEGVASHIDEIRDPAGLTIPSGLYEEFATAAERITATTAVAR